MLGTLGPTRPLASGRHGPELVVKMPVHPGTSRMMHLWIPVNPASVKDRLHQIDTLTVTSPQKGFRQLEDLEQNPDGFEVRKAS